MSEQSINFYKHKNLKQTKMEKTPILKIEKEIAELWSSPSDTPTYSKIFEILDKYKLIEQESMIDFHIEVMKKGLINEGEQKWQDKYLPKIKTMAEETFNENYTQK